MYRHYRQYSADKGRIRAWEGKCDFYPESAVLPLDDGAIIKSRPNLRNSVQSVNGLPPMPTTFSSTAVHSFVYTFGDPRGVDCEDGVSQLASGSQIC